MQYASRHRMKSLSSSVRTQVCWGARLLLCGAARQWQHMLRDISVLRGRMHMSSWVLGWAVGPACLCFKTWCFHSPCQPCKPSSTASASCQHRRCFVSARQQLPLLASSNIHADGGPAPLTSTQTSKLATHITVPLNDHPILIPYSFHFSTFTFHVLQCLSCSLWSEPGPTVPPNLQ